jgi:hypothetical protein
MMGTVLLVGRGVVGDRIAKRLALLEPAVTVRDVDSRLGRVDRPGAVVAALAQPVPHADVAAELLRRGIAVVSVADRLDDVRALTELDDLALAAGVPLVVGAGQSPGLTGLLARYLCGHVACCDEIHVAVHGTAGPACARQHHHALSGRAVGLQDGEWIVRPSGSGRELCWFPEPVGAYDCYRAELAEPYVLSWAFPVATRITARVSANRRDRFTARLPMLTPPHPEGGVGAVRVEVRGADADGARRTLVAGVAELVGTTASAMATAMIGAVLAGDLPAGVVVTADERLGTTALLRSVERFGVRLQEFTGIPTIA